VLLKSATYLQKNWALAWPLALNALLVQSMLLIDTYLVAPLGELQVAAMGVAATIVAFVLGIEIAIGNGVQLLVGRAFGAKSRDDLAVAYWSGLFINLVTAFIFLLALHLFSHQIVSFIVSDTDLARLTESYLSITQYIVVLTSYTQVCTAYCNGSGKTQVPLKGFMIELPVNALLSYVLINGAGDVQGVGLVGAAWGSLIAVVLRSLFLYLALKQDPSVDLAYPKSREFWGELKPQYAQIYPIAANFFILSIGATVYQLLFAQLNLFAFVAITLIFPWLRAATQFPNAWAQASAISISQAMGQGEIEELKRFIVSCTQVGMAISFVIAVLLSVLSQFLVFVYPDIEPDTQAALMLIAPLYIALPIIRAYNTVAGNILRALGYSHLVLKTHFVTQWLISLPICALLILYFEVSIFWAFAMIPIEELLKTLPFFRFKQRYINKLQA
jgi:putative MATE family efflux protein